MKEMFIQNYCHGEENILPNDLDFINRIFNKTLIHTCFIDLPENRLFEQMTRTVYTNYVKTALLSLACNAAEQALIKASYLPHQVTHLVFGTMTPTIQTPALDVSIARQLKLRDTVKKLNIESMGCLTGFRLLGLCCDIAKENEENIVLLVVCDIGSALANQLTSFISMESIDKSNVIVSSLFRDAGGAVILSQNQVNNTDYQFLDHQSFLVPDNVDKTFLQEFDDGKIHLFLDKELPNSISTYVPQFVRDLLFKNSIDISRCLFAMHTGGPRIIHGVEQSLDLKHEQLFATRFVLENYGNLSGSSNLVVLDHIKHQEQLTDINNSIPNNLHQYSHIVALSFGPGLGIECVLLQI